MIESGAQITGEKKEIATDSPMVEGKIYEFRYSVTSLPLGFLEGLISLIMSIWTNLVTQFKGLEILYWRLSEIEFVFQVRGRSTSIWEEVALSVVALACQGLLLVVGIVIVLKGIFEFTKPEVALKYVGWVLVGALGVLGVFLLWPRRRKG
ncbi:hypothetical protein ES702_01716 [subsurface metagenome]